MTQVVPMVFTAPHEALWDALSTLYKVTVLEVHTDAAQLLVRWEGPDTPYGRAPGVTSVVSAQWVYPVEAVTVEGRQTAQLPFGMGTTIRPHVWRAFPALPDVGPVDDPEGDWGTDGGKHD